MKLPDLEKLTILRYPDPMLKKVCEPVTEFGPNLQALAERMVELMRAGEGVGLAAPQVGITLRLFVCNPTGEPGNYSIYVNPRIDKCEGAEERDEGCLSLPGVTVTKRRAKQVVIEAFTTDGAPIKKQSEDLPARIWQHETDHLDGRLITDIMSATDEIANRRALKQLRADYSAKFKRGRKGRCASSS